MYRTNHFNSCNFPICDFSNAQTEIGKIGTGADSDFGALFIQLGNEDASVGVVGDRRCAMNKSMPHRY